MCFSGWELEGRRISRSAEITWVLCHVDPGSPKVTQVLCHVDPGSKTRTTRTANPNHLGKKREGSERSICVRERRLLTFLFSVVLPLYFPPFFFVWWVLEEALWIWSKQCFSPLGHWKHLICWNSEGNSFSIPTIFEELMLLNCGVGEDSWESLGQQGDPTSPS